MNAWSEWAEAHATLFPVYRSREDGMHTLAAWSNVFHRIGVTPAAMGEASYDLAAADVPSWPDDQLKFLRGKALAWAARSGGRPKDVPAEGPPGCKLCHGSGMVSVPQPRAVARLAPWSTVAVTCRCPLGLFIADDQRRRWPNLPRPLEPMTTLREYEDWYPNWRNDLIAYEDGLRDWSAALAISESFGKIVGRITAAAKARAPRRETA